MRAGARRDGHRLREGWLSSLGLDREAGVRCDLTCVGDLVARQGPARLDEPAGRDLVPAVAAETVEGDERRRRARAVRAEQVVPDVDLLDVRRPRAPCPRASPCSGCTSPSVRTLRSARKSVSADRPCRDRCRGSGAPPAWRHRAPIRRGTASAPRECRIASPARPAQTLGCRRGRRQRAPGWTALRSGITVSASSWAASRRTRAARLRQLSRCVGRGELASVRWAEVDPHLSVGQVGRLSRFLRRLGGGDDDDRRCDAEGEGDCGERRSGTGLIANEVSKRQSGCDGDSPGDARRRRGSPAGLGAGSR